MNSGPHCRSPRSTSQNLDTQLEPDLEQHPEAEPELAPGLQTAVELEERTDTAPAAGPALEEHHGH